MSTVKDQIVRISRTTSPGAGDYWMAKTAAGRHVGIFHEQPTKLGQVDLMLKADYFHDINSLKTGESQTWEEWPIDIEVIENGSYWRLVHVTEKPEGAQPDQPLPDWDVDAMRAEAVGRAGAYANMAYGGAPIWDSETTGTNPDVHEIIEIGWLRLLVYMPEVSATSFVRETILIRPRNLNRLGAMEIHGITAEMLKDEPTFPEVYDQIASHLVHSFWIGWNIGFDGSMLINMCRRYGLPPIMPLATLDVMTLFGQYVGDWRAEKQSWRWFRLSEAAEILGIEVGTAHRAADDAVTTFRVLEAIAEQAPINWEVVNRLKAEREASKRDATGEASN